MFEPKFLKPLPLRSQHENEQKMSFILGSQHARISQRRIGGFDPSKHHSAWMWCFTLKASGFRVGLGFRVVDGLGFWSYGCSCLTARFRDVYTYIYVYVCVFVLGPSRVWGINID